MEQIQENTVNVDMDLCVAVVQVPQSSYKTHQLSDKNCWGAPMVSCATMEGSLGARCDRNGGEMHSKNERTHIA